MSSPEWGWEDEPQEDGYYMNEEDGCTKHELPRLRSEIDDVHRRLCDLSLQWDGTDIEPTVWSAAQETLAALRRVASEMDRLGVSVKTAGLG